MPFSYGKRVTLAGLRRTLSWSFLGGIGAGVALFTIAIAGEGYAQRARHEGRPVADSKLALIAMIAVFVVFYVAAIAFVVASCWGAWKLWKGRGVALIAGVALAAAALAGFLDQPLLAAVIVLGWVGYLYFSLGRGMRQE
jgi:hypothetical protein